MTKSRDGRRHSLFDQVVNDFAIALEAVLFVCRLEERVGELVVVEGKRVLGGVFDFGGLQPVRLDARHFGFDLVVESHV